MLTQPVESQPPVGLRADASAGKDRFSPVRGHSEQPTDVTPAEKPDQAPAETPNDSARRKGKEFRKVIDKRTNPGDSEQTKSRCEMRSQNNDPKASNQPDAARNGGVQNPDSPDQKKKGTTEKNAPDTRQQLAGLIEANKGKRNRQVPAKASESKVDSHKTVQATETEAASTVKLDNTPADASIDKTSNRESSKEPNESAAKTTEVIKGNNPKGLSFVTKTVDSTKTAAHDKLRPPAEEPGQAAPTKAPAKNTEYSTNQKADSTTGQFENAAQTRTGQAKEPAAPAKTDAASVARRTPSESPADNTNKAASTAQVQANDTQKPEPAPRTDVDMAATKTPKKQAGPVGSRIVNDGNNTENAVSDKAEPKTATTGAQSGNSRSSGDSLNQSTAQVFAKDTAQTPVAEQTSTFSVETKAPILSQQPQPTTASGPEKVGSQILEAVSKSLPQQPTGDKEITIQLNPPELGKVCVKFRERGAEITGTLEVSKAQTRAEIEHALPEMIRGLTDSGIAIKRLEVVLSQNDQPNQQSSKDPLLQDGQSQQQNSANPKQSGEQKQSTPTSYRPAARGRYQYQTAAHSHEMLVANSTINMLV